MSLSGKEPLTEEEAAELRRWAEIKKRDRLKLVPTSRLPGPQTREFWDNLTKEEFEALLYALM